MFWNQILHGRSVAVFWLLIVQKMTITTDLEENTRQLTRMMDLMPSDFAEVNSTLSACAMIPNQQNFTRHDERFCTASRNNHQGSKYFTVYLVIFFTGK